MKVQIVSFNVKMIKGKWSFIVVVDVKREVHLEVEGKN